MNRTFSHKSAATKNDGNLIASQVFAQVFKAYSECSEEMQGAVREMVEVVNAADATEDERHAALATIAEALFPTKDDGTIGIDLEQSFPDDPGDAQAALQQMDQEESSFAARLSTLLKEKEMTQVELADAIGVGQPAISMMLARNCRPQLRTIQKIAKVLNVAPEDIWPGINGE